MLEAGGHLMEAGGNLVGICCCELGGEGIYGGAGGGEGGREVGGLEFTGRGGGPRGGREPHDWPYSVIYGFQEGSHCVFD